MHRRSYLLKTLTGLVVTVLLAGRAYAAPFDQQFIDSMVPHHQSELMMAQMAVKKAPHREVRNLARKMIRDQQKEIAQLKSWRKAWYGSAAVPMMNMGNGHMDQMNHPQNPPMGGGNGAMMMMGDKMMSPGKMMGLPMKMEMDMGKLRRLRGGAFEKMFLAMMIPHHSSAIVMADEALKTTARPQIRSMARNIIDAQAKEIGDMHKMHHRWYGKM